MISANDRKKKAGLRDCDFTPESAGFGSTARALSEISPFAGVSADELSAIWAHARSKEFSRGEVLFLEGAPANRILLVTEGLVKVTKIGLSGTEVIVRLGVPGEFLGATGMHGKYCATAQALRDCRVVYWEDHTFQSLSERYPVVRQCIFLMLSAQLAELEGRFQEVATEKVESRVACQLVRLARKVGHTGDLGIEVGLSREELAQMTGTTLFTVSRLLSAWEARGIVLPKREGVVIRAFGMLKVVAADACCHAGACTENCVQRCE